jgi:hypothetical protein
MSIEGTDGGEYAEAKGHGNSFERWDVARRRGSADGEVHARGYS